MNTLHLQLVTPERIVVSEEVDSVTCPTTLGQITILPGHIPLVATLVSGELLTRQGAKQQSLHVAGGFVQVQAGNKIVILADAAEHAQSIDIQRAEAAEERAKKRLAEVTPAQEEYALVAASLERSLQRIRIARKHARARTSPITSEGVLEE